MAIETKRININIPVKILDKIDVYAEEMGLTRTSAIVVLLNNGMNQEVTIKTMTDMVNMMKED